MQRTPEGGDKTLTPEKRKNESVWLRGIFPIITHGRARIFSRNTCAFFQWGESYKTSLFNLPPPPPEKMKESLEDMVVENSMILRGWLTSFPEIIEITILCHRGQGWGGKCQSFTLQMVIVWGFPSGQGVSTWWRVFIFPLHCSFMGLPLVFRRDDFYWSGHGVWASCLQEVRRMFFIWFFFSMVLLQFVSCYKSHESDFWRSKSFWFERIRKYCISKTSRFCTSFYGNIILHFKP